MEDPFICAGVPEGTPHVIPPERSACRCGSRNVHWTMTNGQRVAYCDGCRIYVYSVPSHEVGGVRRSRSGSPQSVDLTQRVRIMERDRGRCVLCRTADGQLDMGHLISVAEGRGHGLEDGVLWSDSNLAVMCSACNQGLGARSVSLLMIVALRAEWEAGS